MHLELWFPIIIFPLFWFWFFVACMSAGLHNSYVQFDWRITKKPLDFVIHWNIFKRRSQFCIVGDWWEKPLQMRGLRYILCLYMVLHTHISSCHLLFFFSSASNLTIIEVRMLGCQCFLVPGRSQDPHVPLSPQPPTKLGQKLRKFVLFYSKEKIGERGGWGGGGSLHQLCLNELN